MQKVSNPVGATIPPNQVVIWKRNSSGLFACKWLRAPDLNQQANLSRAGSRSILVLGVGSGLSSGEHGIGLSVPVRADAAADVLLEEIEDLESGFGFVVGQASFP